MIELTKINGKSFVLNAELIETIEETPDTVIKLISDKKLVVKETKQQIIDRVIKYKKKLFSFQGMNGKEV